METFLLSVHTQTSGSACGDLTRQPAGLSAVLRRHCSCSHWLSTSRRRRRRKRQSMEEAEQTKRHLPRRSIRRCNRFPQTASWYVGQAGSGRLPPHHPLSSWGALGFEENRVFQHTLYIQPCTYGCIRMCPPSSYLHTRTELALFFHISVGWVTQNIVSSAVLLRQNRCRHET